MKMLRGAALALLLMTGGCAQAGGLGEILGGVLNAPTAGNQLTGTIQGVDTRAMQVFLQQSNGQTVALRYDNNTRVTYQNQNYPVTALEAGDVVTVRYQEANNGYYVDLIQVTQSASTTGAATNSGSLYSLQGTVRSIDRTNGYFTMSTNNSGTVTISMPYNPRSTDVNRFNALRINDYVQIQALYLNESRFELRQFY